MNKEEGIKLLLEQVSNFNNRYNHAFGQTMLRLDDGSYLMSNENLMLTSIKEEDIKQYTAGSGIIGKIFRRRHDINAIVFACTEASIEFSNTHTALYPSLMDLAETVGSKVRVINGMSARSLLKATKEIDACIIKGVGIFSVGKNINSAITVARIIEKSVEAEVYGKKLNGLKHLPNQISKDLRNYYTRDYSNSNSGKYIPFLTTSENEQELRDKLVETGKKLYELSLVQGTGGNMSVRLNEEEILITPAAMNYHDIKSEDIVKIHLETLNYASNERRPSSETPLHRGIYLANPNCKAIIHTHSNGCSVFAAAGAGFKIANPTLNKIIGDVNVCDYAFPGSEDLSEAVINALGTGHACIMANHGAIFTASNLDNALMIADTVETKACALLGI